MGWKEAVVREFEAAGSSLLERVLAVLFALPLLLLLAAFLLGTGYYTLQAVWTAARAVGWERRFSRGTSAAYAGAAAVDLSLARKAAERGDAVAAEARSSGARDKLDAPQIAGRAPAKVVGDLKDLEDRHAKDFRPIRRERALNRLGKEGAEVR